MKKKSPKRSVHSSSHKKIAAPTREEAESLLMQTIKGFTDEGSALPLARYSVTLSRYVLKHGCLSRFSGRPAIPAE